MELDDVLAGVAALTEQEGSVFLVGGAVRDRLLLRACHDMDFVMAGETYPFAKKVRELFSGGLFLIDPERDTSRVLLKDVGGKPMMLDFASMRGRDLSADLLARDFTINAMAVDVNRPDQLIDPCGGSEDLREKRIRACSATSVSDDPIRVLRAVRQAVALNYAIDPSTFQQMKAAVELLPMISAERLRDEAVRMLDGDRTSLTIRILERCGALTHVFPELVHLKEVMQPPPHVQDVWEHTLEVVDRLEAVIDALAFGEREQATSGLALASAALWLGRYREQFAAHLAESFPKERSLTGLLKLAALYHDTGKPATGKVESNGRLRFLGHEEVSKRLVKQRARRMAFSNHEIERVGVIVAEHMRIHSLTDTGQPPTRRAIYRYFRDTGAAGIDVCLLSLADTWATYSHTLPQEIWLAELATCRALLEAQWEKKAEVVSPPKLVTGSDLIRHLRIQPGKLVGELLAAIQEAQAMGEIHTFDEACAYARRYLNDQAKEGEHEPDDG